MIKEKLGIKNYSASQLIAERRFQRDGIRQDERIITDFQEAEKVYAAEIAKRLNIPLEVFRGVLDFGRIMKSIKTGGF